MLTFRHNRRLPIPHSLALGIALLLVVGSTVNPPDPDSIEAKQASGTASSAIVATDAADTPSTKKPRSGLKLSLVLPGRGG